jgi:hypothetical protein
MEIAITHPRMREDGYQTVGRSIGRAAAGRGVRKERE